MPTAARGATLILLGVLLAQTPLTAAAYEPRDRTASNAAGTVVPLQTPTATPTLAPSPTVTSSPTAAPDPSGTPAPTESPSEPVAEPPATRSWIELAKQVTQTSPGDLDVRAADTSAQAKSMMRCFKLDEENYCLGLGFVDQVPAGAQVEAALSPPSLRADGEVGVEQDIPTGDLSPAAFVAERAAMPKSTRVNAELDEMQAAWDGRDKARDLRLLATAGTTNDDPTTQTTAPTTAPVSRPTTVAAPVKVPASAYIMNGFQTSQEKGYWCGPATFQSIDWADDNQKDTQASWAQDLGATTSGTAIGAMVRQTNVKTTWPKSAGTYIVQNVSGWNAQTFFTVHQKHLGVYKAPVIEHVQLLKRYFPYLAFNHSGHYQVGRGYDQAKGTIGIFEVFNERRFNSRGNVTNGPKNIPASSLFNATLANSFKNIGL
jgi:hypothetical protein